MLLASGAFADSPAKTSDVEANVSPVRFASPPDWERSEFTSSDGMDTAVEFSQGDDRISILVFGAPGSAYKTPADFLAGPRAMSGEAAPVRAGVEKVAGKKTILYRRQFPLGDTRQTDDDDDAEEARMGTEIFCIVPPGADRRFVVLSYARENDEADPAGVGAKAWAAFLKTIRSPGK